MRSDVVYNVFINIKVHTAPSLTVVVNYVNTALKNNAFFFFLVLAGSFRLSIFVAPDALKVTDQLEFWKEVQRKKICLNPILLFLIGELVNFDCENY